MRWSLYLAWSRLLFFMSRLINPAASDVDFLTNLVRSHTRLEWRY